MIFLLLIRVDNGKVPLCGNVNGFWFEQNNPKSLVVSFHNGAAIECIRATAPECKRLHLRSCRANILINQAILKRNINNRDIPAKYTRKRERYAKCIQTLDPL